MDFTRISTAIVRLQDRLMRKKKCEQCGVVKEDAVVREIDGLVTCLCDACAEEVIDDGEDWAFSPPGQPSSPRGGAPA